jgi:hypothetical protein
MAYLPERIGFRSQSALKMVKVADVAQYRSECARRVADASPLMFVG